MFYKPFIIEIENLPIIVYPSKGVETVFDRAETQCLEKHLGELYKGNQILKFGDYHIVILWDNGSDKMVDVWIYSELESWGSGPLVDEKTFRNFKIEPNIGVSAGNALIMLGREEEHRRATNDQKLYIKGSRPGLPDYINDGKSFYL